MATYQELKGHRDLKVYQLAYKLAMEIFKPANLFQKRRNTHSLIKFVAHQEV